MLKKYGQYQGARLYSRCLTVFASLPLAAVIDHSVLVLHGGLFRKPIPKSKVSY
jgi:diadenosine tetraphosphatase ApaH/serine/threonine PP2A family protein phosphatase